MKKIQLLIVAMIILISQLISCKLENKIEEKSTSDLVYPFLDSSNSRWFYFNSASRPFGMVNLSPDTSIDGDWGAGYIYSKDTILGFSHLHGWQLSGIPVLPGTGVCNLILGPKYYGSKFKHENEIAKPGYHKVILEKYNIKAELSSTTRVGIHKYTFPKNENSYILLDLATVLGPSIPEYGEIKVNSNNELVGYVIMSPTSRRPKPLKVFFLMQFDKPFDKVNMLKNKEILKNERFVSGKSTGAYVTFPTKEGEIRKLKVAISYVSTDQARLNMESELPHWDFEKIVTESKKEWDFYLNKIEIKGGTKQQRSRFYTDLWHALLGRRIISDINGKYVDFTGSERKIKQIPKDNNGQPLFNHYNSDSFWGAQWSLNTLWGLAYPKITEEFVNSMLLMYKDGGLIPRGPAGGDYTFVMTGASSTPFIVSAYMKGIRNFDLNLAYEGLRKNHFPGGLMSKAGYEHNTLMGGGIEDYIERGYIPFPLSDSVYGRHQDGAGQTLEYCYQDWALAQLSKKMNKQDDYKLFIDRAYNYQNLFDAKSNWFRVRKKDGTWQDPLDLMIYDNGWVETNTAQALWLVPHDVAGLIKLLGGNDKFTERLNESFNISSKYDFKSKLHGVRENIKGISTIQPGGKDLDIKSYINYGNQPNIHTAFLFNYSGSPWLTQFWSREVIEKVYSDLSPDMGYSGDEDQGIMGSVAVLMKIGLFSVRGGASINPIYELGSPIFDEITINLDKRYYKGEQFKIKVYNNSDQNRYIQKANLNGVASKKSWFYHDDIVNKSNLLELYMGPIPNKEWGINPENFPPSMSTEIVK